MALVEARVRRLESEGRNPFAAFFVAEAAISLKQGAGRLILEKKFGGWHQWEGSVSKCLGAAAGNALAS